MAKYLIDANLPYYFGLWNNADYIHVYDLNDTSTDEEIWAYAKLNNLVIITKDADFSLKALYKGTPPKVVHLKFGNLKLKDFHAVISKTWNLIELQLESNNVVNVYLDRIESIQ